MPLRRGFETFEEAVGCATRPGKGPMASITVIYAARGVVGRGRAEGSLRSRRRIYGRK
ncbi:MAG: hypothetical protein AVDCRST_MAG80-2086 [uncultured Rubrobacteraceae bacterium]|uniref:Uncharacterized protein n=1 Tax=uncultured Rubrobacteraceae bacterium TaxID=349277 RepID=A0A6J4QMK6_9ACTN|nr:MAG: hypothetical protein AVDCRST_MAG80-2086 [uncultured Rubrobacteraceae bacterium]